MAGDGHTTTSCSACPTAETNWTQGTGTGWTAKTQCYETRNATAISSYCSEGVLKKMSKSDGTWDTASASTAFKAKAGSYITGSGNSLSCTQCPTGSYTASAGTQTSCTVCGSADGTKGKTTSGVGKTSCDTNCSNNNKVKTWTTASWSSGAPANVCKVTNCSSGSYYSSSGNGSCTTCANWTYMASDGHTTTSCTACPTLESGWTKASGTGWTGYANCKETKTGSAISSYCKSGVLTKTATSASAWGDSTITTALTAVKGAYVNSQTCTQCTGSTYQATDGSTATACSACPTAETNWTQGTGTGWTAVTSCYETRNATAISSYCSEGVAKKFATNSTTWGTASASTAFKAKAGSYVSGYCKCKHSIQSKSRFIRKWINMYTMSDRIIHSKCRHTDKLYSMRKRGCYQG